MGCVSNPNWSNGSGGNGESANNQSGSTPPAKDPFFDAAHNVNLEQYPGFDLRHPRDDYSHAILHHGPDSDVHGKSKFDSFGELHRARKEYIETYRDSMDTNYHVNEFGSKIFNKPLTYNNREYIFSFERDIIGWHEKTGILNKK